MKIATKVFLDWVEITPYYSDEPVNEFAVSCGDTFAKCRVNSLNFKATAPIHHVIDIYHRLIREVLGDCHHMGNTIYLVRGVDGLYERPLLVHHVSTYEVIKALAKGELHIYLEKELKKNGTECEELTYHLQNDLVTNL